MIIMIGCLHNQHKFNTYGQTTYGEQSCKNCLLTAYGGTRSNKGSCSGDNTKEVSEIKYAAQTPITDTVSHFPSPGGEATHAVFQPHIPLVNRENEIRPAEVSNFVKKLSTGDSELQERIKSPWEREEREQIITVEELKDNNPMVIKSLAEEKAADDVFAENILRDKDRLHKLATRQFYKTSTQRLYEGVDWKNTLKPSRPSPIPPTIHHNTRELHRQIKRYNSQPESFQKMDGCWDFIQSRNGYFVSRPVAFCSIGKKSNQIPNYQGSINGYGEKDVLNENFTPLTVLRTQQPKYQETSRKTYIPGYTGCVLWDRSRDVFSRERLPRVESTARTHHRFATYPTNSSTVLHQGPLSKNVSLTHPFVPYNKVNYPLNKTASGNRVY